MKRALITGITGQDGAYLARFLLEKGYDVYGTYRRASTPNFWRLQYLGVFDRIRLIPIELVDTSSIQRALLHAEPDEVYHLAAQSFVGISFAEPEGTGQVTGLGVTRILESIRLLNPKIKFYQASTSELYGNGSRDGRAHNEASPLAPVSPYAAAKLYGYWITRLYREAYGLFACNGMVFNHESPLRGLEFVTHKISNAVAKIALGLQDRIELGNLASCRDWGYAGEYVEAMWLMLQQDEPDDYVIATGEAHSVMEFAEEAFSVVGLDWQDFGVSSERFQRPLDVMYLRGDFSKARERLGWEPRTRFVQLVNLMVDADLECWQRWLRGEHFPWDAPHYPNETQVLTRGALTQ